MGAGTFINGAFDLVIAADHVVDQAERDLWFDSFERAADLFFNATEGQLRIGRIFFVDDNWALNLSEIVLHDIDSRSYATYAGFGRSCHTIHLFSEVKNGDGTTIVHELGHHLWGLADEYTRAIIEDQIDIEVNLQPPYNVIPILQSDHDSAELASSNAILRFGLSLETRIVEEHTATEIRIYNFFSQSPTEANPPRVSYQIPASCQVQSSDNFSIMEARDNEGITEFCTPANHDLASASNPDHAGDTGQTARHGRSCWEVIQDVMTERFDFPVSFSDPALAGPATVPESPQFFPLIKERRLAVVLDRSGSMGEGEKLSGAKTGVEFWMRSGVSPTGANYPVDDYLTVIWYNHQPDVKLELKTVAEISNLQQEIDEVNEVSAEGWTNIRDALESAVDQIISRDGRAAVQGIVLLTDGVHNSPANSNALEALPRLKQEGIPVYTLAVGSQENVDLETLEQLAAQTAGHSFTAAVGLSGEAQPNAVTEELMLLNLMLRGSLCLIDDIEIVEAPAAAAIDGQISELFDRKERPNLKHIMESFDIKNFAQLKKSPAETQARFTLRRVWVEKSADKISFNIIYPAKHETWLYLINPEGEIADESSSGVMRITTDSPFDTIVVDHPQEGMWTMVIFRPFPGPRFRIRAMAGIDNRRLVVAGDVSKVVQVNKPARIWAKAIWKDDLSGLTVKARIVGPGGVQQTVNLVDFSSNEPESGIYEGFFTPQKPGRYTGKLYISNKGKAILAGGIHRLLHGTKFDKEQSLSLKSDAAPFNRVIPFYFDAGVRPQVRDNDRQAGNVASLPIISRKTAKLKPIDWKTPTLKKG